MVGDCLSRPGIDLSDFRYPYSLPRGQPKDRYLTNRQASRTAGAFSFHLSVRRLGRGARMARLCFTAITNQAFAAHRELDSRPHLDALASAVARDGISMANCSAILSLGFWRHIPPDLDLQSNRRKRVRCDAFSCRDQYGRSRSPLSSFLWVCASSSPVGLWRGLRSCWTCSLTPR